MPAARGQQLQLVGAGEQAGRHVDLTRPDLEQQLQQIGDEGAFLMSDVQVLVDQTVNGVKAAGGAIDGPGAVVANGMVLVNSGYTRYGGLPGNVLLAFAPEE